MSRSPRIAPLVEGNTTRIMQPSVSSSDPSEAAGHTLELEKETSGVSEKPNILVRVWRGYEHYLSAFVGLVARSYGRLGAYIAQNPVKVLAVSLVIGAAIVAGWARFRIENEADVLWVPQTGKAHDDKNFVEANYPRSKRGASFYAQLAPSRYAEYGGDNAVQISVTWEMFQLHNKVMAITVSDDNGLPVTFNDLCYRNKDGTCDTANGYLWYWYKNMTYYVESIQGSLTNPTVGNETIFKNQVSNTSYPDGKPVSLLSVFGGTTFAFNPFQLTSAEVIASDYTLDYSVSDETAKSWHLAVIDLMEEQLPLQQYMTFTFITGSSVGEELGKSINNDMFLVIISLIIFIVIAIAFLSHWSYKTRTTLALAGIVCIALGIMSGWGWGMIFGMPFTSLQQLSPFILLGMGVDVVFILVKALDMIIQREPWLTLPETFSKLMSTAGVSVQATLLASAVAFALGSIDDLPSVRWFSAFATLNTLMMNVLLLTFFIACMVLVEKRINAGRWDCCCCITASGSKGQRTISSLPVGAPGEQDVTRSKPAMLHDDDIKDEAIVKKFFRKIYAPLLARWWIKVPIIMLFVAYAVLSLYGIQHIEYGQPLSDLAPDGSYLQAYDEVQKATYQDQVGAPVGLYFRNIDVSNPLEQYKMFRAWDLALQSDYVNASTTAFLGAWLVSFTEWAQDRNATVAMPENNCYNPLVGKVTGQLSQVIIPKHITGCVPQSTFYTLLAQWLNGKPNNNLVMNADGTIFSSKLPLMQTPSGSNDKYNMYMIESVRENEDLINDQLFQAENDAAGSYCAFIYGGNFVFAEGDAILPHSALIFFVLAIVGVGVVCTFMLVNPAASLLMMIAVGLVILYLFGELWWLNIKFNQVSVINMIMATGLSVDYSVYFAQKFMTVAADGTGNGRMKVALADTGFAVFLGGFTALCGTVPMAFAKSVIIRTFFKLIFGTIIFSMAVGLVFMPVIFSLIPLPPVRSALMAEAGQQPGTPSDSVTVPAKHPGVPSKTTIKTVDDAL